ncbi:MAG: branched-chain-amino-acid transaminase [Armatimonadota bacterium]
MSTNTQQQEIRGQQIAENDRPIIYLNGEFVPRSQAVVSVYDHGFLYGDGVFEGIRAYHGLVFRLREHLLRLERSARAIALTLPMSLDDLQEATLETLRRNGFEDSYIRLIVTRGVGDLGLDPRKCYGGPGVIIIADRIQLYPEELYAHGLELITVSTRRNIPDALSPAIKSLNYLNNILAKIEVVQAGLQEGIMLNAQGYVAEATGDNVFLVQNGKLVTPPLYTGCLEGITRNAVMDLAREAGIQVEETPMTMYSVYAADECFLTGTAAEIIPVVTVDSRAIGTGTPGPVTAALIKRFRDYVQHSGVPIYV